MNKPMILIVEDDAAVRNLISTTLKMQNYKFHVATTGSTAQCSIICEGSSTKSYASGVGAS